MGFGGRVAVFFALLAACARADTITLNGKPLSVPWHYMVTPDWERVQDSAQRIYQLFFSEPPNTQGIEEFLQRYSRSSEESGKRLSAIDRIAFDFIQQTPEFAKLADEGYQHRREYWQQQRGIFARWGCRPTLTNAWKPRLPT
jgi:hypothetical protein